MLFVSTDMYQDMAEWMEDSTVSRHKCNLLAYR